MSRTQLALNHSESGGCDSSVGLLEWSAMPMHLLLIMPRAACCCRYGPALYAWLNGYATGVGHHVNYYKVTCRDST
jgi:hypothetical protein